MPSAAERALAWREALAAMRATGEPYPGIGATVWPTMCETALDFLEQHGVRAAELGWTAKDLFGVHPKLGTRRVDHAGALVVGADRPVDGFEADRMCTGHLSFYRSAPGGPKGIPIWQCRD